MIHEEHVDLIKKAITTKGGVWADLGSGDGAFTLALRDLAGDAVEIYSIDQDKIRLKLQEEIFDDQFPESHVHYVQKDFTQHMELPKLDGIIMANSLHYVKAQSEFLKDLQKYLKTQGKLILVEYNIDTGNPWVPYPLSFTTFEKLAKKVGFSHVDLLKKIPSTYWDEMYSAVAELS